MVLESPESSGKDPEGWGKQAKIIVTWKGLRAFWTVLSDIGFDFGWSCVGSGVEVDDPCGFLPTRDILWFWVYGWQVVLYRVKQSGRESKHCPLIVAVFARSQWRSPEGSREIQSLFGFGLGEELGARYEACHCRRAAGMDIFHSCSVDRKIHPLWFTFPCLGL